MKNSPFYNFSKIVGGPPFSFFYPHTSNHRERIPKEGKVIICSNHISLKDPPMLALDTKRQIFYMAKSELFENKFVGSLITALGAFSVDRGVGDSNALDRCGEILEQDGAVGIFIEGTRSLDGKLGKPKYACASASSAYFACLHDNQNRCGSKAVSQNHNFLW